MFRRKVYDRLVEWRDGSAGRAALLVGGARRVGESMVVGEFGRNEYRSCLVVDFAFAPPAVHALFDDLSDLNYLLLQLQLTYGVRLYERESLVVFDEVQLCPRARQAVKALVADGRYDYVETGSLISIRKSTEGILIPSEERRVRMFPMDFEEFRWAQGDEATVPLLRSALRARAPLGDAANRKVMRDFRLYMLVGGMPQTVDAYLQTNSLEEVDRVKRGIVGLYEEDFNKIDPSGAVSRLFDAIPAQLAKKPSRYHVSSVLANRRSSDIGRGLSELAASRAVLPAYHVDDPNVGMAATVDLLKFKLCPAVTACS